MKKFDDLNFISVRLGIQAKMNFENGYGVSVIRTYASYGGTQGLYELGILDSEGRLTYSSPITDDVLGYLTPDQVTKYMEEIQKLPPHTTDTLTKEDKIIRLLEELNTKTDKILKEVEGQFGKALARQIAGF